MRKWMLDSPESINVKGVKLVIIRFILSPDYQN